MKVVLDYDKSRKLGIIKSTILDEIRDRFSEVDPQARIKKIVSGCKYIPTRNYCITKSGKFEMGMTADIIKYLKGRRFPVNIEFTDGFKDAFLCGYSFHKDPLAELKKPKMYKKRYYQEESIRKALKMGNGIFLLKTAAGKTYISAQLIGTVRKNIPNTKTLMIVPTVQLVEQTYNDYLDFGFSPNEVSKWSGKNTLDPSSKIIIANSAILLSKSQDLSFLSDITLLIVDECHSFKKGNRINQILKHITTRNIFGFTGTLPETKIDQWNVIGKLGPILYELSREEMVKNDFISDAEIRIIDLTYKSKPKYITSGKNKFKDPLKNYALENKFTESNKFRNGVIRKICSKVNNNILIVVEHLEHGETLKETLSEIEGKQVFFIRGDVEIEDREKYKQIMEIDDNVICIAISKIFSTGINVKNLHYIIFASAGKAKIKLIQSIGRGLRLHKNKIKLFIFDIADKLKYGEKHLQRREEIYEEEGFVTKRTEVKES